MNTPKFLLVISCTLISCASDRPSTDYSLKNDPEIYLINNRLVPRKCAAIGSLDPQTHRVFTLPSIGFMSVKVDLGKMDLDPKQVQPLTESLIALSWGREALCLNVKERAVSGPEEAYQAAWNEYTANTQKLMQFAMIALMYKPEAATKGPAKQGTTETPAKPKETPTPKQNSQKTLVDAIQKWLDAYGTPASRGKKKVAVAKAQGTPGLEAMPAPQTSKQRLLQLRNDLIEIPAKRDSKVGL